MANLGQGEVLVVEVIVQLFDLLLLIHHVVALQDGRHAAARVARLTVQLGGLEAVHNLQLN